MSLTSPLSASSSGTEADSSSSLPSLVCLPWPPTRSVRWRIQLGLLPPTPLPVAATTTTTSSYADGWTQKARAAEEEQLNAYEALVELHPMHDENNNNNNNNNDSGSEDQNEKEDSDDHGSNKNANNLDPLTFMMMEEQAAENRLQELDLKYRKEKARRKRGIRGGASSTAVIEDEEFDELEVMLQVIDKDLERLPQPDTKKECSNNGESNTPSSPQNGPYSHPVSPSEDSGQQQRRKRLLRRVLFIFASKHPTVGYRQGMHEVASWLLYAQEQDWDNTATATCTQSQEEDPRRSYRLAADTYNMLRVILTSIAPAYDCNYSSSNNATDGNSGTKPLEAASRRVVMLIARHDRQLWECLQNVQVPPALFLAKWLRLLFSRECSTTAQVLLLWDFFMEQHQQPPQPPLKQQQQQQQQQQHAVVTTANSTTSTYWMTVLEAAAAARLLLWRRPILFPSSTSAQLGGSPNGGGGGDNSSESQNSLRLQLLMNVPPETNVQPIVKVATVLLSPGVTPEQVAQTLLPLLDHAGAVAHSPSEQQQRSISGSSQPSIQQQPPVTGTLASIAASAATTLQQSTNHMNPLAPPTTTSPYDQQHNNSTNNLKRFSFTETISSVKSQAKTATKSLGQRLHQEWDTLKVTSSAAAATSNINIGYRNNGAGPMPSGFTDPLQQLTGQQPQSISETVASHPLQQQQQQQPPPPQNTAQHSTAFFQQQNQQQPSYAMRQHWGQKLEKGLRTLQQFVMTVEQQKQHQHLGNAVVNNSVPTTVPNEVWEALADLEILRQDLLRNNR